MTLAEMEQAMLTYCQYIDRGIEVMREAGAALAVAERAYQEARSEAWGHARGENVKQREAWVDAHTAAFREERDRAENRRRDAIEAVRARQSQLSGFQTMVSAHRAEAEFVRTAP